MPKSKPAFPSELTDAMDRLPDLTAKDRVLLESALTLPYSPVEWSLIRKSVFVPVESRGVVRLIHEFLQDRARDPKRAPASRQLCRKAATVMSRDLPIPTKPGPKKVRYFRTSRPPKK